MGRGIVAAVTLALILGGCGGGSSHTVTVTGDQSQPGSSSGGTTISQSQELTAFLARVQTVRAETSGCVEQLKADISKVNGNDQTTWASSADAMKKDTACIRKAGKTLAAIQAPAAVADAYTNYVSEYGDEADIVDEMANDLKNKDTAAILDWQSGPIARLNDLRSRSTALRVALSQYAAKLGVTLPPWVATIGRG